MRLEMFCLTAVGLSVALYSIALAGQTAPDGVEAHVKAAETAAGQEHNAMFHRLCDPPAARGARPPAAGGRAAAAPVPRPVPDRSTWYHEPVKVFDNLYFLGQSEFAVWAVTTSDGIILIDTIFDYSVEEEVVGGLKKLGLDPTKIKYAIVSHGHGDHSGGAKFIQQTFGARIIMGAPDWDLIERGPEPKPRRDIVATDGMKVTLGDTTLTVILTPGHTQGTVSTLIPVKDRGRPHTAALWGGTLLSRDADALEAYSASARKFRDAAAVAGADILLSNHTDYDGSKSKLPAVQSRKADEPNAYIVGNASVSNFLTMAEECGKAQRQRVLQ